jgi:TRAP-type mannitol/chloroaromatic compound transport system substrate-binding protein
MTSKYDAGNVPALKRLAQAGVEFSRVPAGGSMDACFAAAQELFRETSAKNANFKKVYDNFMMAQQRAGRL